MPQDPACFDSGAIFTEIVINRSTQHPLPWFQQENKVGSFMRNGDTFKISIGAEEILIYDIEYLKTHH